MQKHPGLKAFRGCGIILPVKGNGTFILLTAGLLTLAAAQERLGKIVVEEGKAAPLPLSAGEETCLVLPKPLTSIELPPGVEAKVQEEEVCLSATSVPAQGTVTLRTSSETIRLQLQAQKEGGGTYHLVLLSEPAPPKAPPPPSAAQNPTSPPPSTPSPANLQSRDALWVIAPSWRDGNLLLSVQIQASQTGIVLRPGDVRVLVGNQPTEAHLLRASYTSGREGWLPPGGSASLLLEIKHKDLQAAFPSGIVQVEVKFHRMDKDLSEGRLVKRFSLNWSPTLEERP